MLFRSLARRLTAASAVAGYLPGAGGYQLCIASALLAVAPAVEAQQQRYALSIPAQTLEGALVELAEVTGATLLYSSTLTRGLNSPAVTGDLTLQEALDRMLQGSGLDARFSNDNTVTLARAANAGGARVLGPVRVEGAYQQYGSSIESGVPTTEGTGSYTTGAVTVAGKTPLTLRETPNSVTVVTRQRIEDQQLTTAAEALEQAPGVLVEEEQGTQASVTIRGFRAERTAQFDGVPLTVLNNNTALTALDTALYDRIEVRKGADGLLQGPGQPAGTINFVRKRPQETFGGYTALSAGRYDNYRIEADLTGSLTDDNRLRGRLIGVFQDREYFYDVDERQTGLISGLLDFDLTPRTLLRLSVDYDQSDGGYYIGLPGYSDGGLLDVPRSTYLAAPWHRNDLEGLTGLLELEQQIGEQWKLKISARNQQREVEQLFSRARGPIDRAAGDQATTTLLERGLALEQKFLGFDAYLSGRMSLLGREHELLLGANWQDTNADQVNFVETADADEAVIPVFGYDPQTDSPPPPTPLPVPAAIEEDQTNYGLYFSVRSSLTEKLTTILGARVSWFEQYVARNTGAPRSESSDDAVFSPYAGIVYDVGRYHSLYASYADIFQSQATSFTRNGDPLDPAVGAQYEAGVKGEYLDGRVNASFAIFQLKQMDTALIDPEAPEFRINGGEVQSEGIEVEVAGEILPNLQLSAGYTYNDLEITIRRDATGQPVDEGRSFAPGVPRNLLKVYGNYRFTEGALRGLSVGGGAVLQDEVASGISGAFARQGGYVVYNARLGYEINERYRLSLNLNNASDRVYYSRVSGSANNRYGEPFAWLLTFRSDF